MHHREIKHIRIVSRTLADLIPVIREIQNPVRIEPIHRDLRQAAQHFIIIIDRIVVLVRHDFFLRPLPVAIDGIAIIFLRIAIPIADMATHQMHDNELPTILRIHFFQIRHQRLVIILRDDLRPDVLIHPVLLVAHRANRADRRIPYPVARLIGNPRRLETGRPRHIHQGKRVRKFHVIILILFRQRIRQHMHRLRVASIRPIKKCKMVIPRRRRLKRGVRPGVSVHIHMVAIQRFPDDQHIHPVRHCGQFLQNRRIFDLSVFMVGDNQLVFAETQKRLVRLPHRRGKQRPRIGNPHT